ncbi:hypothetical protein IVB20_32760, partial [Bradyrhizobium sp. 188]|nr:hypothetical protein [Bradyrhizobium sp. 188]
MAFEASWEKSMHRRTQSVPTDVTPEYKGRTYLDGWASNPRTLGWMHGSPPPADKQISFESDRSLNFPEIRWSLSHMRELVP